MSAIVGLYTDGGCIGRNPSPLGGTWAWAQVDADGLCALYDSGLLLPGTLDLPAVSNNHAELYAMVLGLESLPPGWSGTVGSDSEVTLGRVFQGWRMQNVPAWLEQRARAARERLGAITPVLLDGHPTKEELTAGVGKRGHPVSRFNVLCDRRCRWRAKQFLDEQKWRQVDGIVVGASDG